MTLIFRSKRRTIKQLVLDTGAGHLVISMVLVDDIGIYGEIDDEIVAMCGISGVERSIRKKIDSVEFGTFKLPGGFHMFMHFSISQVIQNKGRNTELRKRSIDAIANQGI